MKKDKVICMECKREREEHDHDYNPFQLLTGSTVGWYSGEDGEICGPCMKVIFERANK